MWIFLSGSRGTLAIGTLCFVSLMIGMRGMRQRTVALVGAVMLALVVLSHFSELQDRTIKRITKLVTTDHSMVGAYSLGSRTSGRSDLAIGGWYIFQEHPLGVGTGGFPTAWSQFGRHYGLTYGRGQEKAAHSGWLKTLVENGIPGIVLMAYFIFSFGVVGMRQRSWALWRLGMLTTVVLAAAFISSEFQTKGLWFLAAGAITFLQRDRVLAAMYGRDPAEDDRFGGLPRRSYAEVRER
jgi:O-antigen ligase